MNNSSVVNIVGGGDIGQEIDLGQTAHDLQVGSVEYNPSSFAAVIIRYESPKATVILYESGKFSLAGAQTVSDAETANDLFVSSIESMIGHPLPTTEFEIRYLVATADLETPIDLEEALLHIGIEEGEYEPEQFPALFYRPMDSQWFCSIFGSGKIVVNGCRSMEELEQAFQVIKSKLNI